ncbi:MAG: hypothetical protein FWG91_06600 [Lachnospiraceae bacterium]|nr:hypothetical protein [Lachnospiraceae bacterium]
MIKLNAKIIERKMELKNVSDHFSKALIYYMVNKNDLLAFFITYIIVDFENDKMIYIFTYQKDNVQKIHQEDANKYQLAKCPHCSLQVVKNKSFLTFNEDEHFFVYVDYEKSTVDVLEMADIIHNSTTQFDKMSHTFFKDYTNSNYFFLSAVDKEDFLHIYRVSVDLKQVEEIYSCESKPIPPHVLRNYKEYLFLSDEFRYSKFELKKKNKIVTQDELGRRYYKLSVKLSVRENRTVPFPEERRILYQQMREQLEVKCLPGRIMVVNSKTKEHNYYDTTGGSPAHFEIDEEKGLVYTSSHNFFGVKDGVIYFEPAVIDKFKIEEDKMIHIGSFSCPMGYRYTSHKIFKINNKSYLCTFGQPNRLVIACADDMKLLSYHDIGPDELTDQEDLSLYINSIKSENELIAVEVSQDNKIIIFADSKYLYFFDFDERKIFHKIEHYFHIEDKSLDISDYILRTVHFNYLD